MALALFRLSTKSILHLDSAAEVYGHMKDMTSHSISIEGLIRMSDALRQQVRLEDIISRRKDEVKALEEEMAFD